MSIAPASVKTLHIESGSDTSDELDWETYAWDAEAIVVDAPDSYAEAFTWEVTLDGTNWKTLNDISNAAIPLPDQGCAIVYNGVFTAIKKLRIKADTNVAADRDFIVRKAWRSIGA